jgi:hypothetical protein
MTRLYLLGFCMVIGACDSAASIRDAGDDANHPGSIDVGGEANHSGVSEHDAGRDAASVVAADSGEDACTPVCYPIAGLGLCACTVHVPGGDTWTGPCIQTDHAPGTRENTRDCCGTPCP